MPVTRVVKIRRCTESLKIRSLAIKVLTELVRENLDIRVEPGRNGEFTVLVGARVVKEREGNSLPSSEEVINAIRSELTARENR